MDIVVIDTSALGSIKTFSIIDKAKKVIIPSIVLREINHIKEKSSHLAEKCQRLLRESALDLVNEKYFLMDVFPKDNECADETIARNAANIQHAILITNDYGMCNFCKLYRVEYILISEYAEPNSEEKDGESTILESNGKSFEEDFPEEDLPKVQQTVKKQPQPFELERQFERLYIKCMVGRIKVNSVRGRNKILSPNQRMELFPDDNITIEYKKTSRYRVEKQGNKLSLIPIV